MKLYRGRIGIIAQDIIKDLTAREAIEVAPEKTVEVRLDIESVLKEYLRTDRELNDETRDILEVRNLPYKSFGRIKHQLARKRQFSLGDDAIDWIINQLIEVLLHTIHVDEVWVEDHLLRKHIRPILVRHMSVDEALDQEVRSKIKNLTEGTSDWDVQYEKTMERIRRVQKLD